MPAQLHPTKKRHLTTQRTALTKYEKFHDFLLVWQDMTDLASNEGMVSFSRKLDAIHTLLQFWKEGKQVVLLMQLAMESLFRMKMSGLMIESLLRMKIRMNELPSPAGIPLSLACKVGELVRQFRQLPSMEAGVIMPILPRVVVNCLYPTRPDFNDARLVVNRAVTDICKHIPGVYTWRQRCFRLHPERFFRKDGVHRNFLGMRKYINKSAEHPCLEPGVVRRKMNKSSATKCTY